MRRNFRKLNKMELSLALTGMLFLICLPLLIKSPYIMHIMIVVLIFAIFGMSWNLCTGFTGLKTFGHQAFFGIGAYLSALVAIHTGISPWITMWIGALGAAVFGVIVGISVLRIRSIPHMAIVTMGMAEIVRLFITNLDDYTGGETGLRGVPPLTSFKLPVIGDVIFNAAYRVPYYAVILILFILVVILYWKITQSKLGLGFVMIREEQDAAEAVGLNLTLYKLLAFGITAFVTGVIGAFYGHYLLVLTPISVASLELMTVVLAIVMVGGLGRFMGPIIGAFVLTYGIEYMRGFGDYQMLFYGGLIMASVMFFPKGLAAIKIPTHKLSKIFLRQKDGGEINKEVFAGK